MLTAPATFAQGTNNLGPVDVDVRNGKLIALIMRYQNLNGAASLSPSATNLSIDVVSQAFGAPPYQALSSYPSNNARILNSTTIGQLVEERNRKKLGR